jgi:ubiquinone/menaquinone biosynthesis C-methylase UbiE
MKIIQGVVLLAFAGIVCRAADNQPAMHRFERQDLIVRDFEASGYILDIGGGGEGIIGRMKPSQVIAIDIEKRELEEAPPGPLKIVMDAADLKFLDSTFDTVTAFFTLMYMPPDVRKKAFAEAFRVMKPGGRWLIWDAVIPTAMEEGTTGPAFFLTLKLPRETVRTGYATGWPAQPRDLAYYKSLAQEAGFRVAEEKEHGGGFHTFFLELRKP